MNWSYFLKAFDKKNNTDTFLIFLERFKDNRHRIINNNGKPTLYFRGLIPRCEFLNGLMQTGIHFPLTYPTTARTTRQDETRWPSFGSSGSFFFLFFFPGVHLLQTSGSSGFWNLLDPVFVFTNRCYRYYMQYKKYGIFYK